MLSVELISEFITPIHPEFTGSEAIELFQEYQVDHLPIVDGKSLLGIISESEIFQHDLNDNISSYGIQYKQIASTDKDHYFDIIRILSEYMITAVPVVDDQNQYVGLITYHSVLKGFAQHFSFAEPGTIVVLEMNRSDYSMSDVARIAELEDAVILHTAVHFTSDQKIEVHLKLNKQDIQSLVAAYERYNYLVKATFIENDSSELYKDHYESLLHYLNM